MHRDRDKPGRECPFVNMRICDELSASDRKPSSRALIDGRYEDDGWRLRKDGSRFWANFIITAIRNESGQLVGYSKLPRDLMTTSILEVENNRTINQLQDAAVKVTYAQQLFREHLMDSPIVEVSATMGQTSPVATLFREPLAPSGSALVRPGAH